MATIQDALRNRARTLLEEGIVYAVVGWEAGRFEKQTTPLPTFLIHLLLRI